MSSLQTPPSAPLQREPAPAASAVAAAPPEQARPSKPHPLAWIALGTAVIGFIFAAIPGALILGWILLPIAFVLSIVGMFVKGRKWPSVTALILAVVGTIVAFVVFFAVVLGAAGNAIDNMNSGAASERSVTEAVQTESEYAVTIDGATQGVDYDGQPALIVDFTFTNNSDEAASFMSSLSAQAFQDGVELDMATVVDGTVDANSALKDVKPGATITVQEAFVLDGTSEVTIEVSELFTFDDSDLLAVETFPVS